MPNQLIHPQAVFTASINAALLSLARDIISDRNSGPTVVIMNSTSLSIASSGNNDATSVAEQVIFVCFYLAMLLSLCAGAFAWLMHSDTLENIWEMMGMKPSTMHLSNAVKTGSMFWLVSFIIPSTFLTCIGLEVLVWNESTYAVSGFLSGGMVYCLWRLWRVLSNISSAPSTISRSSSTNLSPSDLEKGVIGN